MSWYVYEMSPIDFGWSLAKTVKEVVKSLSENPEEAEWWCLDSFIKNWQEVLEIAHFCTCWEGDYRVEPRVFVVPQVNECELEYGFCWKQSNNGLTFLITPQPILPPPYDFYISHEPDFLQKAARRLGSKYKVIKSHELKCLIVERMK